MKTTKLAILALFLTACLSEETEFPEETVSEEEWNRQQEILGAMAEEIAQLRGSTVYLLDLELDDRIEDLENAPEVSEEEWNTLSEQVEDLNQSRLLYRGSVFTGNVTLAGVVPVDLGYCQENQDECNEQQTNTPFFAFYGGEDSQATDFFLRTKISEYNELILYVYLDRGHWFIDATLVSRVTDTVFRVCYLPQYDENLSELTDFSFQVDQPFNGTDEFFHGTLSGRLSGQCYNPYQIKPSLEIEFNLEFYVDITRPNGPYISPEMF